MIQKFKKEIKIGAVSLLALGFLAVGLAGCSPRKPETRHEVVAFDFDRDIQTVKETDKETGKESVSETKEETPKETLGETKVETLKEEDTKKLTEAGFKEDKSKDELVKEEVKADGTKVTTTIDKKTSKIVVKEETSSGKVTIKETAREVKKPITETVKKVVENKVETKKEVVKPAETKAEAPKVVETKPSTPKPAETKKETPKVVETKPSTPKTATPTPAPAPATPKPATPTPAPAPKRDEVTTKVVTNAIKHSTSNPYAGQGTNSRVAKQGKDGYEKIEITYTNGKETSRRVLERVEPVTHVIQNYIKVQDAKYETRTEEVEDKTDPIYIYDQKDRWFVKSDLGTEYYYSAREARDRHHELGRQGYLGNWGTADPEQIKTFSHYNTITKEVKVQVQSEKWEWK